MEGGKVIWCFRMYLPLTDSPRDLELPRSPNLNVSHFSSSSLSFVTGQGLLLIAPTCRPSGTCFGIWEKVPLSLTLPLIPIFNLIQCFLVSEIVFSPTHFAEVHRPKWRISFVPLKNIAYIVEARAVKTWSTERDLRSRSSCASFMKFRSLLSSSAPLLKSRDESLSRAFLWYLIYRVF